MEARASVTTSRKVDAKWKCIPKVYVGKGRRKITKTEKERKEGGERCAGRKEEKGANLKQCFSRRLFAPCFENEGKEEERRFEKNETFVSLTQIRKTNLFFFWENSGL